MTTSSDKPALDCAYKLQEYDGQPRRKHSPGKATLPGRKQVWRQYGADGRMKGDVLSVEEDTHPGEALLVPVMRGGRRTGSPPALSTIRARAAKNLERLPERLRRLEQGAAYPVTVAKPLIELAAEMDRRLAQGAAL